MKPGMATIVGIVSVGGFGRCGGGLVAVVLTISILLTADLIITKSLCIYIQ